MEDDLEQQLLTLVSPELAATYIRTIDLFDEIGSTDHLDTIEQNMGITDYQSGGEFNNMIRDTLERQLTYELGKFSIQLNADVPYDMDFCCDLLQGMYQIDKSHDGEAMLAALCTDDEDARERLFRVLTLITPIDEDEFFIQVDAVHDSLITRLNSVYDFLPEGVTEEVERLRNLVRERTRKVKALALPFYSEEDDGVPISEALLYIETVKLGYDIIPVLSLLAIRIFQQEPKEAVADIAVLCAGSNVVNVAKAFRIVVDLYFVEPDAKTVEVISYFHDVLEGAD